MDQEKIVMPSLKFGGYKIKVEEIEFDNHGWEEYWAAINYLFTKSHVFDTIVKPLASNNSMLLYKEDIGKDAFHAVERFEKSVKSFLSKENTGLTLFQTFELISTFTSPIYLDGMLTYYYDIFYKMGTVINMCNCAEGKYSDVSREKPEERLASLKAQMIEQRDKIWNDDKYKKAIKLILNSNLIEWDNERGDTLSGWYINMD